MSKERARIYGTSGVPNNFSRATSPKSFRTLIL